ncbi:phosphatase PAP2 family protein [Nonlabens xiamenensis]|uniref:phosphatase PAP2 family protein n=1 Tax=Nonlabens xiamenensis TaxID=2341043 RepID=UPI000F60CFB3|nr:phosphatase PAP2 family protein [Nonlabens xiamenensis]
MRNRIATLIVLVASFWSQGQEINDSLQDTSLKFKPAALILPAGMITYGIMGINNDPVKRWDREIRESLEPDGIKTNIDDYSRFAPIAAVYGLNLAGIEGKHQFWDRTLILGTSTLLMYSSVNLIKNNTSIRRPSGRSLSSFPSGHTAIAFMGAEFMHQEFKHLSAWYSVGAYSVAALSGFLRVYNDKHWFSDVVAGAGIGILCTKIGYWVYPMLKSIIFKKEKMNTSQASLSFTPFYNGRELMLGTGIIF